MVAFILSQILTIIFSENFIISQTPVVQYAPFGNQTVTQATENSGLFILLLVGFTVFLLLIARYRLKFIFKLVVIGVPIFILFVYTDYHLNIFLNYFSFSNSAALSEVIAVFFTFSVLYGLFKKFYLLVTSAFILMVAEVSSLLTLSLSPPTLYILPLAFALYDIYSVFRGPLKRLIKVQPMKTIKQRFVYSDFGLLVTNVGGFTIGAGDFIFYALLVSSGFLQKGLFGSILVGIAINFGVLLTLFILLKYKKPLPGLPIPVFLGLLTLVLLNFV